MGISAKMTNDIDYDEYVKVYSKQAGAIWYTFCNYSRDWHIAQFLLVALVIYMLPKILRTVIDIFTSTLRMFLNTVLFWLVVAVAINAYFGFSLSPSPELNEVYRVTTKFVRKSIQRLVED